ncbi:MAG: choice-of-anchor D domain-containing protein [Oligoflexia bacterium]|nr:choice-of-anchor D domain-containing protein [Oligoflexia bacterium]
MASNIFYSACAWSAPVALIALLGGCNDYKLNSQGGDNLATEPSTTSPTVSAPDIDVQPASLDFGGVLQNCASAPLTVTVSNVGDETLTVSDLSYDLDSYALDWDGNTFSLDPGDSREFNVVFTPDAYVTITGDLTVSSDDPDEPTVVVPSQGFGDVTAMFEEGFTQEAFESLDVMWVVDNSCSMDEELSQVRSNFESFIDEFVGLGLDYHLAVITTDMDQSRFKGRIQGGVITPDSADPGAEFLAATDQGSSGSGDERGMDAVKAALSEPLISTDNAGFLREDSALAVIILSDEDDGSTTSDTAFNSWFTGLKTDSSRVSFNAIVGDPSTSTSWGGCTNWVGLSMLQADAGDRYVDMANSTGGIWRSICYEDYDETLSHVSLTSAGMVTTYVLAEMPTSYGNIEVYVDDTQWSYSLFDGWTYNSDENSITFHGDALPQPGAVVLIQYPIEGECSR